MKREEPTIKQYDVLQYLSCLPRKMLLLNGNQNMTEFVLHELCNKNCFNFSKAAYFVDNQDFNCMKGVAGWNKDECALSCDIWQNPQEFSSIMCQSPFNQKVKEFNAQSFKKESSDQLIAQEIAKSLNMSSFGFCSLGIKHDNHGLLVFEPEQTADSADQDHIIAGLSLLGFCPVH